MLPLWVGWMFNLIAVWLCVDALIIGVIVFSILVIKPRFPHWWRRVIADQEPPEYYDF